MPKNLQVFTGYIFASKNFFSWLLSTAAILVAIHPWTTARSGYILFVTAAASEKSPGEVNPSTLGILIGSNANITCHLYNPDSSKIWFLEEKSKRKIQQPADEINIIDPYTAMLSIHNAVEQKSQYNCMVGPYAIGATELFVGTKPQNVTDFSCTVYDYDCMECSFTRPKNMLLDKYKLEYRFDMDSSTYSCEKKDSEYNKLKYSVTEYFPVREYYSFTLTGTNDVGQNVQNFTVNNHKIVIPSALDVIVQNVTSDSITLTWEKLKIAYYPDGLTYEIQVSSDNRTTWHQPKKGGLEIKNGSHKIQIKNLYAFWNYWIKVRAKSNAVDENNNDYWSEASEKHFHTKATQPKRAPETPLGSFYIDSMETQLRLYWEKLPDNEHNGPGFHYIVNELDRDGVVIFSTTTNETSTTFAWKNESMQMFIVKSANNYGESKDGNIIRVYRSSSSQYELSDKTISKLYHNSSYTLSWSPPAKMDELMNYTIFWCLPKIELPNQCKGPISYKYLGKFSTNFTTEPKDRSLNLAISANYPSYNKGMQWARCSGDISSELMKMELDVNVVNESAIVVKWSSGSVCASILKGYNLTYYKITDGRTHLKKTVQLSRDNRTYTISGLPAFTDICLYMFMYSPSNLGPISDVSCQRTKASAPSPPRNLTYKSSTVTSKSAVITWKPPNLNNGLLRHYRIYWRIYPHQLENDTIPANQTSYTITGLSSYSNYEVYVTAETVEESTPSNRINLTTLIGMPSFPRNVNIFENDTIIHWDQPDLPSGRHLFFLVALVRRDYQQELIYERVSLVKGRSCRFQWPDCLNTKKTYSLTVRAVTVGERNEVDMEIKSMSKDVVLAGAPIDQDFCVSNEVNAESFDIQSQIMFENGVEKFYFACDWVLASRSNSCSTSSNASIYVVALIISVSFAGYICYWIRSKYYKMKNIKVILPEGLVDQVSNYKFASNAMNNASDLGSSSKKEFHSDISRSNDCLVAFNHKENHNLISSFHNGSSQALSSLSSSNSSTKYQHHHNENQMGDHPSLETTNEELSSNSSSAANSNLKYHDHHQIERLSSVDRNKTLAISTFKQEQDGNVEDEEEEDVLKHSDSKHTQNINPTQNSGYVTHNSQLLASILNGTDRIVPSSTQFNPTFPPMTNDGYIQPSAAKQLPSLSHHPPPINTNINGYTSIEELGKMSAMPNETTQQNVETSLATFPETNTTTNTHPSMGNCLTSSTANVPLNAVSSHHHHQTSPDITDLHDSTNIDYNKDTTSPLNGTNVPTTTTLTTSQQPNSNNNNTIYGYVTQQQLANFGTNVALGKELNT